MAMTPVMVVREKIVRARELVLSVLIKVVTARLNYV
jgi:hypothetical protein